MTGHECQLLSSAPSSAIIKLLFFSSSFLPPPQVLFGTADGQVIVMDCHGRMLAHILLHESDGIVSMSWNFPSFQVEDSSESDTDSDDSSPPPGEQKQTFFTYDLGRAKVTWRLG